ncbi:hypothetical protein [Nonomuraea sp. NPDC005501]|uniref:P-type ATPase n=1 Tax=Nonomuraea sp. NPDC005501 TaxID=3156884 RepID=UPI0033B048D8
MYTSALSAGSAAHRIPTRSPSALTIASISSRVIRRRPSSCRSRVCAAARCARISAGAGARVRDGQPRSPAASQLVPGDVLVIEEGARTSAGTRLTNGGIEMDLSALAGEAMPVFRSTDLADTKMPPIQARGLALSTLPHRGDIRLFSCSEVRARAARSPYRPRAARWPSASGSYFMRSTATLSSPARKGMILTGQASMPVADQAGRSTHGPGERTSTAPVQGAERSVLFQQRPRKPDRAGSAVHRDSRRLAHERILDDH